MDDHYFLEWGIFQKEIAAEAEAAVERAGGPLGGHALNLDTPRLDADPERPALDEGLEGPSVRGRHSPARLSS